MHCIVRHPLLNQRSPSNTLERSPQEFGTIYHKRAISAYLRAINKGEQLLHTVGPVINGHMAIVHNSVGVVLLDESPEKALNHFGKSMEYNPEVLVISHY